MSGWWAAFIGNKQINLKAVFILLVALVVGAVGVFFLHVFQVRRNASGLLEQAALTQGEGNHELAVTYLKQYVGLVPADREGKEKLGLLLSQKIKSGHELRRAYLLLSDVLRNGGDRPDLRLEVIRLAIRLGRYRDGREQAEILLKSSEDPEAELWQLAARCEAGLRDFSKAADLYRRAMLKAPRQADIALEYAALLRSRPRMTARADDSARQESPEAIVEFLKEQDGQSPQTQLQLARYFVRFGDMKQAWQQLQQLIGTERDKTSEEALLLAAEVALSLGDVKSARELFEQGRHVFPKSTPMRFGMAQIEVGAGAPSKAIYILEPLLQDPPKEPVELWRLASLLIDARAVAKASGVIAKLSDKNAAGLIAYLEARLQMDKGKWAEAIKLLDRARADRQYAPILAKQAYLLIAECNNTLRNPDQSLAALGRAVDLDPNWTPAVRALALALAATGQLDQAVARLRKLASQDARVKEDLVRLLMEQNRRLPENQRDWAELKRLQDPANPQKNLAFQVEILFQQGKLLEARKLAEAERDRDPDQVGPWLALIALAERQSGGAKAMEMLDEAERRPGKRVEWPLTRLRLCSKAGPEEIRKQLPNLLKSLDQFQGSARDRLAAALGTACAAIGDKATARRLWSELADHYPDNLDVRFAMFEMTIQANELMENEFKEATRLVGEMKRIEGGEGAFTAYAEGAMRVALARQGDKAQLAEARRYLARAGLLRPSWAKVPLLEGEICELEGQKEKALTKYRAALDRGEGRLIVVQRVLQLMQEQHLFADANALLAKLSAKALATPELGRLASQVTLFSAGDEGQDVNSARQQSLTLARKVAAVSNDYRDHLWLGQVALLAGYREEAEKSFRQACKLKSAAPEVWTALIFLLARSDPAKAEAELARAQQSLATDQAALVSAAGYEILGQVKKAEEQLQTQLKAKPNDPVVLRASAAFFARHKQQAKAEPILRTLLGPTAHASKATEAWARRSLALLLASQRGYQQFKEAEALLNEAGRTEEETLEDRIVRAQVLATQPARRAEAIQIIKGLPSQAALPDDVRFLLAQLYETNGNWPAAEIELLALLRVPEANPVYLERYISGLLRRHKAKEAQVWVEKLAKVAPKTLRTLELRVRGLMEAKKNAEAVKLVQDYVSDKEARLDVAARWLERLGEVAQAEKTYRAFAASSKEPEAVLSLALHLGRQKKVAEALAICEVAWADCRPEAVARASVSILRTGEAGPAQWQAVEGWITAALKKTPPSKALPILLAELYEYQQPPKDSLQLYRTLLEQDPHNVAALNNLAFLLAVQQGEVAEPLKLINQAIELAGPVDELLDTRAVIYLKSRQPNPALRDLHQALAQAATPTRYFHFAQAQLVGQDKTRAAQAWQKAKDLGLKATDVHPQERAAYQKLAAELN